ncbi:hypothetical protein D3C76_1501570 [compost metagenome]
MLDDGQMKDAALNHFQHILDRQTRIDPLDRYRRQLVQGKFLIDLADGVTGSTAGGQCHGLAR